MAFKANVEFVRAKAVNVSLEEIVTCGQVPSAPISKSFKRQSPFGKNVSRCDYGQNVDLRLGSQSRYSGAANMMNLDQRRSENWS